MGQEAGEQSDLCFLVRKVGVLRVGRWILIMEHLELGERVVVGRKRLFHFTGSATFPGSPESLLADPGSEACFSLAGPRCGSVLNNRLRQGPFSVSQAGPELVLGKLRSE